MPYADITMFRVAWDAHWSATSSLHWLWTALYSASPVRFAIWAPDVKSVVAHIAFMSPAISNVPWVDRALDLVFDKTSLMPASFCALADVSFFDDAIASPWVAFSIAFTSPAVFGITSMFRSLKSCSWSAVWARVRSRDLMSVRRDEQTHRRYVSFCLAQNWSMQVKYASRHVLYPVPNVLDAVAARAGVRAARDIAPVIVAVVALRAVRAFVGVAALRAVAVCTDVRALRADVVAALRAWVAVRVVTVPLRGVVAVVRAVTLCGADVADVWRFTLDASRTAALARPMPATSVPAKSKNFFITT